MECLKCIERPLTCYGFHVKAIFDILLYNDATDTSEAILTFVLPSAFLLFLYRKYMIIY